MEAESIFASQGLLASFMDTVYYTGSPDILLLPWVKICRFILFSFADPDVF